MKRLFTSESVTSGHPDKICDLIADTILDTAIAHDPYSHMAVECTIKDDLILIYGEANTKAVIDYEKIALKVMKEIGYNEEYHVRTKVNVQSSQIDHAVNAGELCAGDQGIMFGYACRESKSYMPYTIDFAHMLAKKLEEVRRANPTILKPDGKTQVTIEYDDDKAIRVDTVLISTSHYENISYDDICKLVRTEVIDKVIPAEMTDENTRYIINPSGMFTICGSWGDSGTTGRKIVVDTYGGVGHIGGGCFSSKDPTKVDRSAAYYARYVCKSLVAQNYCDRCELQLAYSIGQARPVSIAIDTFNTGRYSNEKILEIIKKNFDFSVANIIDELDLRKPIYASTVNYGHFGKPYLPWEKIKEIKE